MNIEKERELFLEWHYNTFLLENPNIDINNAQYIYDYSHTHEMVHNIRENNFAVWLASANREGYKLVSVEPSDHMRCVVRDFDPDVEDYANMDSGDWESLCADIYKAMIGACDDH